MAAETKRRAAQQARRRRRGLAVGLALLAALSGRADARPDGAGSAAARPTSLPAQEKPWARGVSPQRQARALALFRAGNQLFASEQYSRAARRYEAALEFWSHPNIHYNIVECLMNLGRNVEAYEHLKAAMRYGEAPFGPQYYRQARTYRNNLEKSLARVTITCREPAARVTLDGVQIFVGPGTHTRVVAPGSHALLAVKRGHISVVRQLNLSPGERAVAVLQLVPQGRRVTYTRRWQQRWLPWTVLAAGVLVAAAALPPYLVAHSNFESHRAQFEELCGLKLETGGGCVPDELTTAERQVWRNLEDLASQATDEYHAAIGLLVAGAVTAAAGVALVVLNLPRAVERSTPGEPTIRLGGVSPVVSPDGAGLGLSLEF